MENHAVSVKTSSGHIDLQEGSNITEFNMNASGHGFGIQTSSGTWNSIHEYTTGITNVGQAMQLELSR